MTNIQVNLDKQTEFSISGIAESTILDYFQTINEARFPDTASLFIENGQLIAPFTEPILGRRAIANYLEREAKGMQLKPQTGEMATIENDFSLVQIVGKAKTALFRVNVAWFFTLNGDRQIVNARIKLLASPQELLKLRQFKEEYIVS
jgi:hypothetical protein